MARAAVVRARHLGLGDADESRRSGGAARPRGARAAGREAAGPLRRLADDGLLRLDACAADARRPAPALDRRALLRRAARDRGCARSALGALLRGPEGDRPRAPGRGRGARQPRERALPGRDARDDAARPGGRRRADRVPLRAGRARRRRRHVRGLGRDPEALRPPPAAASGRGRGHGRPPRHPLPRPRAAAAHLDAGLRVRRRRLDGLLHQRAGPRRRPLRRRPAHRGLADRVVRRGRRARQRGRLPLPARPCAGPQPDRGRRAGPGAPALAAHDRPAPGRLLGGAGGVRARRTGSATRASTR